MTARLVLWEENINCLNCLQSYKLENVLVKEYACENILHCLNQEHKSRQFLTFRVYLIYHMMI